MGRKKKSGQKIICLWHGCGYKSATTNDKHEIFDYVFVPGEVFIDSKSEFFGCNKRKVIPLGYSRYDLFYQSNSIARLYVESLKGSNDKLIIWMPTYRKSENALISTDTIETSTGLPLITDFSKMKYLDDFCSRECIFIVIKLHPYQAKVLTNKFSFKNIKFITNSDLKQQNVELYSFLKYTDALITDYSSVGVDYMLLDKPIGFVLEDFVEYQKQRGFVFEDPLQYMPGNHIFELNDLLVFLHEVVLDQDSMQDKRKIAMSMMYNKCSNYSQRITDFLGL